MTVHPEMMDIVRKMTDRLVAEGAVAVMLMGSHVRGDAHAQSDIDLPSARDRATRWNGTMGTLCRCHGNLLKA